MSFTMATWNVDNFSSAVPCFRDKVSFLAESLRTVAADVVALQDVRDLEALAALAGELSYDHVWGAPDAQGSRVALIAKRGLVEGMSVVRGVARGERAIVGEAQEFFRLPRPLLEVQLDVQSRKLTVIVAHLDANAANGSAREPIEVVSLRTHVQSLRESGLLVIVAGDLGDGVPVLSAEQFGVPGDIHVQRLTAHLESAGIGARERGIEPGYELATATFEA